MPEIRFLSGPGATTSTGQPDKPSSPTDADAFRSVLAAFFGAVIPGLNQTGRSQTPQNAPAADPTAHASDEDGATTSHQLAPKTEAGTNDDPPETDLPDLLLPEFGFSAPKGPEQDRISPAAADLVVPPTVGHNGQEHQAGPGVQAPALMEPDLSLPQDLALPVPVAGALPVEEASLPAPARSAMPGVVGQSALMGENGLAATQTDRLGVDAARGRMTDLVPRLPESTEPRQTGQASTLGLPPVTHTPPVTPTSPVTPASAASATVPPPFSPSGPEAADALHASAPQGERAVGPALRQTDQALGAPPHSPSSPGPQVQTASVAAKQDVLADPLARLVAPDDAPQRHVVAGLSSMAEPEQSRGPRLPTGLAGAAPSQHQILPLSGGQRPLAAESLDKFIAGKAIAARPETPASTASPAETPGPPIAARSTPAAPPPVPVPTAPPVQSDPLPVLAQGKDAEPDTRLVDGINSDSQRLPPVPVTDLGPSLRQRAMALVQTLTQRDDPTTVLSQRAADGWARTEISLAPAELGRVKMVLQGTDRGLVLQIAVERPETLDVVRRHLDSLQRTLANDGVELAGLNIGSGGAAGQDRTTSPASPPELTDPASAEILDPDVPAAAPPPPQLTGKVRLDIRI